MPRRVNHLRIGEAILINKDNEDLHVSPIEGTFRDVFTLKAEIVESRVKPTHPVGEIGFDAFRGKPVYEDRGDRARAIAAVGKLDYGYIDQIVPRAAGVAVIGASSDHTILDIEDSGREIKSGDVISFDLNYAAVAFLSKAPGVRKAYV
jgi:predicted amino acid racemase